MIEFFQNNRDIVFFLYGEVFFVLGLAVALQSRKHSQIGLAQHLWLLAVFGIVHGIYEWGAVFIPIQQKYLLPDAITFLRLAQLALEAISFGALVQFGIEMIALGAPQSVRIKTAPLLVFAGWIMIVAVTAFVIPISTDTWLILGDTLSRYALGTPGALAAAWGLWRQAQQVRAMDLARIAAYFRGAALAFIGYAAFCIIVPRADFFPASVLNYDTFIAAIGIPVAFFRAGLGTAIAYLIIRGLEIFDVETDRLIEQATRVRAIATDRERISRELHDGIIQSLYAAGITLEDASLTLDEDAPRAKQRIGEVMRALNHTIRDIRAYILDLRSGVKSADWCARLDELVRNFRLQTLINTEFHLEGEPHNGLADSTCDQILAITHEALTNIGKHARATSVEVALAFHSDDIRVSIADNGNGFARDNGNARAGDHQGLRNMQERARLIGGKLEITSEVGRGTMVQLTVPCVRG